MEKSKSKSKLDTKSEDVFHHQAENELSHVVLHAGELGDARYLRDYIQMTKLTGELKVNEQDSRGCTPLHFAVTTKRLELVATLIEYGANVNLRDQLGFTPLFLATGRYPDARIANYLIEKGRASVHVTNDSGACALHGASMQGNLECMKVLLKYGADPRCADQDSHTPLDLAKDDATRALLHKSLRHADYATEQADSCCASCGATKNETLKRCGRCFVTMYCSKECQTAHWLTGGHKKDCAGYVTGRTARKKVFSASVNLSTLRTYFPDDIKKAGFFKKKKFLVKVQVPVAGSASGIDELAGEMMVYNEDRVVNGFISQSEKGYMDLRTRIAKDGWMGIKAFFWAELNLDREDGTFKVFHGKCAPYQTW